MEGCTSFSHYLNYFIADWFDIIYSINGHMLSWWQPKNDCLCVSGCGGEPTTIIRTMVSSSVDHNVQVIINIYN